MIITLPYIGRGWRWRPSRERVKRLEAIFWSGKKTFLDVKTSTLFPTVNLMSSIRGDAWMDGMGSPLCLSFHPHQQQRHSPCSRRGVIRLLVDCDYGVARTAGGFCSAGSHSVLGMALFNKIIFMEGIRTFTNFLLWAINGWESGFFEL